MKKFNMIRWLSLEFESWSDVYDHFQSQERDVPCVFGWYMGFDGPSVGEMFLVNKHPSSDLSCDVITSSDFLND